MKKQSKIFVWIILLSTIVIIICALLIILITKNNSNNFSKFSCTTGIDCVSQCRNGCVNSEWATLNPDMSECFRAWDCSCVNNKCYTDDKPPKS